MEQGKLKQSLSLYQVIMFGLAYMAPMIVFGTYGTLYETTNGFVPYAYLFATIAMLFTAYSYGQMAKAFPSAGSAYTFVSKSLHPSLGFMVGWTILLDYLFLPLVIWLIGAEYLTTAFPMIPSWAWIIIFIVVTTLVNIIGINTTTSMNLLIMIFQLLVITIFIILCIWSVIHGMGEGHLVSKHILSLKDNPISPILAGAAIACYSFLGFDAVTTLAEETNDPRKTIPKAIMLITIIGGFLFVLVAYVLSITIPNFNAIHNTESAAFEIAKIVGGNFLSALFLSGLVLAQLASGLSAQTSGARLLYAMGRDGVLNKKIFGFIERRSQTPIFNLLFIGVVGIVGVFMSISTSTSFINFGAFISFAFVNVSVIAYYFIKLEKRKGLKWIPYLLVPVIGVILDVSLFVSLDKHALILGGVWTCLGFLYLMYLTKCFSKLPPSLAI
ncbi:APC family permease [Staphylococcus succinus]|uniref:APC family permease n=1 Tax=Staphylococcus succinus TaxID=61015 RepID=A0A9Q6HRH3_9STAP|nr:APC family permease [Staphylococcus succinus]MEB8126956.1 APC family permease [Staphylococcus succinus]PTI40052.1 APC family permease [Staphylococcus succinus]PTI76991.1 APC family permease [Staphylococcus succinus]PTJ19041.1 APC family permease [Staphylococcus succinus]RIN29660.1 APC family permease [Staphylococcus succinus]